ncbi:hypothetical protein AB0B15_31830 [Streptomyces sp. NPDC045456]|uniref:hypothetical protein n=1 Tax=Streptomyces sp. NPDC045456 TaxID=3155254 RepID=UPI0033E6F558
MSDLHAHAADTTDTSRAAESAEPADAQFWYAIPHGYLQLDLTPPVEQVQELVDQVSGLPDAMRAQAEPVLQFYAGLVTSLNAQNAQACLLGMHLDEDGNPATSVITFSTVPSHGLTAKVVIAGMAGADRDASGDTARPLQLRAGLAFFTETERRTIAPGRPPEGSDVPPMGAVWQGTVAVTGPGGANIVVIQLVTSAVAMAEDYRNILLGVAETLSFTDPARATGRAGTQETEPKPDSVGAAVRNVFG